MTLIELFNAFNDASRRINLTSDARSLFLAFMQHWNEQRRPQAVNITVQALRKTASLNEDTYRRAAISLSNNKFWSMKRKAHYKDGRLIKIGEYFTQNQDRRETAAKSAISGIPPCTPPVREENLPSADFVPAEEETEQTACANDSENPPNGGFSVEYFRDRPYDQISTEAALWLQNKATPAEYEEIIALIRPIW